MMLKIGDFVDVVERNAVASVPVSPDRWMLVRVHPNRERQVHDRLTASGICCYVPQFPRCVTVSRRFAWQQPIIQRRSTPVFPGLAFVPDFDADMARLRFLSDGVAGLLFVDGRAASLSSADVEAIRAIEADLSTPLSEARRRHHVFAVGDRVRVRDGSPFAMWTGRIDRLDGKGRLRVLIAAIKREVTVELSSHQVEPA